MVPIILCLVVTVAEINLQESGKLAPTSQPVMQQKAKITAKKLNPMVRLKSQERVGDPTIAAIQAQQQRKKIISSQ